MKRVLVIGSCGAGKSTFARKLHEISGLPLIHLDRHYWKPGWVEPEKEDWAETVGKLISRDTWIIDGNYGGTMEMRIRRADTVIWLDLPSYLCVYRILKRIVLSNKKGRADMAHGCEERFEWEFIKYVWKFRDVKNPLIRERIDSGNEKLSKYQLGSDAQAAEFLSNLKNKFESGS